MAWVILFISFGIFTIYETYGVFWVISYSRLIRSGIFPVDNKYSFLQRFGGLAFSHRFLFLLCGLIKQPLLDWLGKSEQDYRYHLPFPVCTLHLGRTSVLCYLSYHISLGYSFYKNKCFSTK